MAKQKIVIIGGGFGGVKAALNLAGKDDIEITLVTRNKEFRYYPSLFRVATGGNRSGAAIPLKELFKDKDIKIVNEVATKLDRENKCVILKNDKKVSYDQLILALGNVTNYFGIEGLDKYSFSIKTQDGAEKFKDHIHDQISKNNDTDLNYVIVGGGPTGIELAGALPAYLNYVLRCHGLEGKKVHIDIIEASPQLLPRLPKNMSHRIAKRLANLGVNVYLDSKVEGETIDQLMVNSKPIKTHSVVWTAGVTNNPFFKENDFTVMKNGLVAVNSFLQAEPGIYVIGDNANTPYSGMAQTALRDANFVSINILRSLKHKTPLSYIAKKPISVIPVGDDWAAVNWGRFSFYGRLGQLIRKLADFEGFSEIESPKNAYTQLKIEYSAKDNCLVCQANTNY